MPIHFTYTCTSISVKETHTFSMTVSSPPQVFMIRSDTIRTSKIHWIRVHRQYHPWIPLITIVKPFIPSTSPWIRFTDMETPLRFATLLIWNTPTRSMMSRKNIMRSNSKHRRKIRQSSISQTQPSTYHTSSTITSTTWSFTTNGYTARRL